jgi:carboxylate-amine ligase
LLQDEFLNSRGAIARFSRNAIEIRVLDVQECPKADLAICALVVEVLKLLCQEHWTPLKSQQSWEVGPLEAIFLAAIKEGQKTAINDPDYLAVFGLEDTGNCTLRHLWRHLHHAVCQESPAFAQEHGEAINHILLEGTLAKRILNSLKENLSPLRLKAVYAELCDCLRENRLFSAAFE